MAQESAPPAAEKSAPPGEDPIAAARRDFNSLKGARNALEQSSKLNLPSVSAPDFTLGSSPMPRAPALSEEEMKKLKAAKKSTNWLVDAMMKPEEKASRDPRERATASTQAGRDRELASNSAMGATKDPEASLEKGTQELAAKDEKTLPPPEKRTGPEFNPLASYMSGWMTPQDYSLLKPGIDNGAAATASNRGDPSLPGAGADLSVLGDAGSALDLGKDTRGVQRFELPKPADNPFLQSFNAGSGASAPVFSAPPAPVPAPVNALLSPAPDLAPARSKIPDFVKPAVDEKYFKQLKRF